MNIDAIATLVFNFFLLFKRITAVFNVQFCCFAGNMSSRSHFLSNWWTNDNALAFVSRFVFGIISKCFIVLVSWFVTSTKIFKSTREYDSIHVPDDVKLVKNEKPTTAARVSIKSDRIPNSYDDKLVGKEWPTAATTSYKAALLKELEAVDLQLSLMDAVMDKISYIADDLSQSVGKQTIHCVTKPIQQQAASIKKPLKPPIPSTILPVKQPNPCTGKPLTQSVHKQPIHTTEELTKRPLPSTRKAVKQPNPCTEKPMKQPVRKQPILSTEELVKRPIPSTRKAVKQPNPCTRKPFKQPVCKQSILSTKELVKWPILSTIKAVKQPHPCTRKPLKQPVHKQPILSTEELLKRPIPSTRKAVKQLIPSFRKAVKQPNPSTKKPIKNPCPTTKQPLSFTRKPPIPTTRKPIKNPSPSTRKLTKQPSLKTTSKIAVVDDSHYIQRVIISQWKF